MSTQGERAPILDPKFSPHCLQNRQASYVQEEFSETSRILNHENFPESQYVTSNDETEITTVHYGRRQLLINEIEFLTMVCCELEKEDKDGSLKGKSIVVIYAGAAIGSHLPILAELFPFLKFVLIDPARFNFEYGDYYNHQARFRIIEQNMSDSLADRLVKEYRDEKWIRLFISDIRSTKHDESKIRKDHETQRRAHEILKPYFSSLKFRPPYFEPNNPETKNFEYLDGKIYFLIWGRSHTSETRLICRGDSIATRNYDCQKFENQLYHFNAFKRPMCYRHHVMAAGIDHCYDCRAEVYVLERYLTSSASFQSLLSKMQVSVGLFNFPGEIDEFVEKINRWIQSDAKSCEFTIRMGELLFSGRYKFTRLRYGQPIIFESAKLNFIPVAALAENLENLQL